MSISIDWQPMPPQHSNPNESAPAEELFYPRINHSSLVRSDELFEQAAEGTVFSRGEIGAAFYNLVRAVARQLSQGNTVSLDELGTFRLRIVADKDMHRSELTHTSHVRVGGLTFAPSPDLLSLIGRPDFKWQPTGLPLFRLTDDQIRERLTEWFTTHDAIKCKELSQLIMLKQTATTSLINRLIKEGFLQKSGKGKNTMYHLSRRTSIR